MSRIPNPSCEIPEPKEMPDVSGFLSNVVKNAAKRVAELPAVRATLRGLEAKQRLLDQAAAAKLRVEKRVELLKRYALCNCPLPTLPDPQSSLPPIPKPPVP